MKNSKMLARTLKKSDSNSKPEQEINFFFSKDENWEVSLAKIQEQRFEELDEKVGVYG